MARASKWDKINARKAGAKNVHYNVWGERIPEPVKRSGITTAQEQEMERIEQRTGRRFIGATYDQAIAYIEKNGKAHSRKVAIAQLKEPAASPKQRVRRQSAIREIQADEPKKLRGASGIPGVCKAPNDRWRAIYKGEHIGVFDTKEEAKEARDIFIECYNT